MSKLLKNYLFWIFLLALFLRIYKLGELPVGFHADEVRVAWNALSILKTGADDWGNFFPLHYNTFGDFRPTGYFYLTVPFVAIFGNSEWSVRLPGAIFGALTVISLYFFCDVIFQKLKTENFKLKILASFLLAISPWHVSLSRATSEGIVAIFLIVNGLYFLVFYLQKQNRRFLAASFLLLVASYFFYHSARLTVPFLVLAVILFYRKDLKISIRKLYPLPIFALCFTLFALSFAFSLNPDARARFSQVSIFYDLDVKKELDKMPFDEGPNNVFIARMFHNKPSVYARRFINEYTQYISSKFFLVPLEAKPTRYATIGVGILTYVEFALFIAGLVAVAQNKKFLLPLLLLLISILPAAATTEDAPNMHRSATMIPFIMTISALGILKLQSNKHYKKPINIAVFTLLTLNFIFYAHMYLTHNKIHLADSRSAGARELALKVESLRGVYDKVLITNIPDSPYPWIAYFNSYDPRLFNQEAAKRIEGVWQFENLVFTGQRCPSRDAFKQTSEKILVVDARVCETEAAQYKYGENVKIVEQIKQPDETVVYTLWSN